jgi:hypothetical protein
LELDDELCPLLGAELGEALGKKLRSELQLALGAAKTGAALGTSLDEVLGMKARHPVHRFELCLPRSLEPWTDNC